MTGSKDRADTQIGVPPRPNGSIFRIVDFAPSTGIPQPVEHHKMLVEMGIDPATQGYSRHMNTHRTRSIDYALVLEGEIDMPKKIRIGARFQTRMPEKSYSDPLFALLSITIPRDIQIPRHSPSSCACPL